MAELDYTAIHRSGQNNASGDVRGLYLKLYAGEVLTAFQSKNIMMPLHRVRTISKGKSAQFPMTGKYRDASYHTPGAEIVPSAAKQGERIVEIDDLLINAQFIPNIDEAMTHYDIRSVYTQEAGFALAKVADENILRMAAKAAVSENTTIGGLNIQKHTAFDDEDYTGNVTFGDVTGNTAAAANARDPKYIVQAIMDARRVLDNANVPGEPFIVMPVDMYYDLFKVSGTSNLNDLIIFNRDVGGGGSVATGQVPTILGMPIYVTQHLGYYSSGTTWVSNLYYQATPGSDTVAIAGRPTAHKDVATNTAAPIPLANTAGSGRGNPSSVGNSVYDVPKGASSTIAGQATKFASSMVAQKLRALVMTQDAVASAKLMDMSVESEYQITRQGTLMVSKYAMGHNILRPACSVGLFSV